LMLTGNVLLTFESEITKVKCVYVMFMRYVVLSF
jgi:hypothetical protein